MCLSAMSRCDTWDLISLSHQGVSTNGGTRANSVQVIPALQRYDQPPSCQADNWCVMRLYKGGVTWYPLRVSPTAASNPAEMRMCCGFYFRATGITMFSNAAMYSLSPNPAPIQGILILNRSPLPSPT